MGIFVDVWIPSCDASPNMIDRCVDSMLKNAGKIPFNITVLDSSRRHKLDRLRDRSKLIRVLEYENERFNFAHYANRSLKEARTDWVLLINDDITIPEGNVSWLDKLISHGLHDQTAIVGCILKFPDGELQHAGIGRKGGYPVEIRDGPIKMCRQVVAVTGACMLFNRKEVAKVGAWDEAFTNGYEDIDFCLRATQLGVKIFLCTHTILTHVTGASREGLSKEASVRHWDEKGNNELMERLVP